MDNAIYPQLAAAIEGRLAYLHRPRTELAATLADQRRARAWDLETQKIAREAYVAELLPTLLPSEWIVSRRDWYPFMMDWAYFDRSLFDHADVFRRRGARGPNTWRNCALVGHPYGDPRDRRGHWHISDDYRSWLHEQGLGVWARPDLSFWYPGWTWLVIAAQGLRDCDASGFGFQALA